MSQSHVPFIIRAKLLSLYILSAILLLAGCNKEDPQPPIEVNFVSDTQSAVEGSEINISLPLERAAIQAGTIKIQLSGNATYTEDYNTNPSGNSGVIELSINAGATAVLFTLATVNNEIYKGDKEVIFTLVEVSEGFVLGPRKTLTVMLSEDESPAMANFQTSAALVAENLATGFTIQIPFSEPTKGDGVIVISLGSNNATYGSHYTTLPEAVNNTISLPVSSGTTGVSITLLPKDDSYFHENYVVVFDLTSSSGSLKIGTTHKFTGTIVEDESPSYASFSITDNSVPETQTAAVSVPISLSIPASEVGSITVSFTSTSAVYGTHFTTIPAASGGNIVLDVAKNAVGAELQIFPIDNAVDNENRLVFFTISSGGGVVRPAGNINYVLTLVDNEPTLRTVFISFGRASAPFVGGVQTWNHLYDDSPSAPDTWSNFKRSDGVVTNIGLVMNSSLTPQPLGSITGINSGVFPDNAMKEYWYVPGPLQGITRGFSLLQLDDNVQYTIKIQGGTTQISADGRNTMTISVEGDQKNIQDVTNNVTQVLQWLNKFPVASKLTINLTDTDGGGICPMNAMEISWYEN